MISEKKADTTQALKITLTCGLSIKQKRMEQKQQLYSEHRTYGLNSTEKRLNEKIMWNYKFLCIPFTLPQKCEFVRTTFIVVYSQTFIAFFLCKIKSCFQLYHLRLVSYVFTFPFCEPFNDSFIHFVHLLSRSFIAFHCMAFVFQASKLKLVE